MDAAQKKKLVWSLVAVLAVLHYDFWFWSDGTLAFGFMPIGLLYQAFISIAAAVVWALAVKYCWPFHIEEWAGAEDEPSDPGTADVGGDEA